MIIKEAASDIQGSSELFAINLLLRLFYAAFFILILRV